MQYGLGQRARWLIFVLVAAGHGLILLLPGPRPAALPAISELQVQFSVPAAGQSRTWQAERQASPPVQPAPARPANRSALAGPDSRQARVEPARPAVSPGTSAPLAPSVSAGPAETATGDEAGDKGGPLTGAPGQAAGTEPGLAAAPALRTPASCDTRLRAADYPALARRHGIEGRVLVQASVLRSGQLDEVRVIRSSGFAVLDEAALRAGRRWRCTPARSEGMARDSVISVPVVFRIED